MALHTWNFDNAHSEIGFTVKHMMFAKVRGQFTQWTGSLQYDPENIANATVEATIKVGSVDTQNEGRDTHLRSGDFFLAEEYPDMTFKSTGWSREGGKIKVNGDLSIRGTTQAVTLDVTENGTGTDPWGNKRIGFSATTTINRKDFGLNWNAALEAGGVLVGEEVKIDIEVQATLAT